jgi:hypothetical protein
MSQMCDRTIYYVMDLGQIVKDTQGEGISNTLKEEWEKDMRTIIVEVGIELWEGEDFIRRFYENYIEGVYKWSLEYYRTGERPNTFERNW